jgi:TonB family protein
MPRFTFLLLSFTLVFCRFTPAQDRTLIAEGDYAAQRKEGEKILAHWKLWHLRNGEYEAVESTTRNALITQTFRFDARFMPIGFALKFDRLPKVELDRHPEVAANFHPMSVSCDYKPDQLSCATEYDGRNSVSSVVAKAPYVFIPGEFYALDFTWFLTGVVHLIERNEASENVVNVYVMADSETKHDEIDLKPDVPIRLTFTGTEKAAVMGKTQEVRKYEGWEPAELSVLSVTSQGLVALMSGKSTPTIGFGISNYIEHEPWVAPFHPVLHPSAVPEPTTNSTPVASTPGPPKRVKVSSGVMAGMVLKKVQPAYPESAKQKGIQGPVLLSAVIGTDGHILQLKPIYGREELVPAAISAVQQWEYRPYILSGQSAEVETEIQVQFTLSH